MLNFIKKCQCGETIDDSFSILFLDHNHIYPKCSWAIEEFFAPKAFRVVYKISQNEFFAYMSEFNYIYKFKYEIIDGRRSYSDYKTKFIKLDELPKNVEEAFDIVKKIADNICFI